MGLSERLDHLSPREMRLIKEAAVMGYVEGAWSQGATKKDIPKDTVILQMVIRSCLANSDLYPLISNYRTDEESGDGVQLLGSTQ